MFDAKVATLTDYVCAECGGTFERAWSEEEARAELTEQFPWAKPEGCDIVCDDCYQKIMGRIRQ